MKKVFSLAVALCMVLSVAAQGVREITTELKKQQVRGFELVFDDQDVETVTNALKDRLEKQDGLKVGKEKGFTVAYLSQALPMIGQSVINIYAKVEGTGKKGAGAKLIMVFTSDNGTPFSAQTHPDAYQNAMNFVDGLGKQVHNFGVQQKVDAANAALIKAQKEEEKLRSDKEKLDAKVVKLRDKIVSLEEQLNKTKTEMTNEENALKTKSEDWTKAKTEVETINNQITTLKASFK